MPVKAYDITNGDAPETDIRNLPDDICDLDVSNLPPEGWAGVTDLGNRDLLSCSVFKANRSTRWLFALYDFGGLISIVYAGNVRAFTRYLKEISETCCAAHQASNIYDEMDEIQSGSDVIEDAFGDI